MRRGKAQNFSRRIDLAGRLTESTDQNGSVITSTYDAAGRLTGRSVNRAAGVIGTTEQTFSYDDAGRLTSSTDNNDPGDSADDATVSKSYDALGRTTTETVNGHSVQSTYTGSRRTEIEYPGGTQVDRSYDAAGNLDTVKRDGTTQYVYDGWQVVEERDGGGQIEREYTYGNYIDEPITLTAGGNTYYYHTNNLYNVRALTDASGDIVERYRYSAYGEPRIYDDQGGEISQSAVGNPYMFQGRRHDAETDLYYYRNRYYSAQLGRFVTRDPKGYVDGYNLYEYVGSHPMLTLDPMGLEDGYWSAFFGSLWKDTKKSGANFATGAQFAATHNPTETHRILTEPLVQKKKAQILMFQAGGASLQEAEKAATGLRMTLSDFTGATDIAAAVDGIDYCTARKIESSMERWQRGLMGTHKLAMTGAFTLGAAKSITAGYQGSGLSSSSQPQLSRSSPNYLEYKSLRLQGYRAADAYKVMQQFRAGLNPGGKFGFHFTSRTGGASITKQGVVKGGYGVRGHGVYAGTTPTPSWPLKHTPGVGWGLSSRPVRIPIDLQHISHVRELS